MQGGCSTKEIDSLSVSSKTTPLVSVCIPTFNGARWIRDCLASVLAQSYSPLEIVVIDDASKDETAAIVKSIRDDRIRLVVNEQNEGLPKNWNKCIGLSRGSFIKFLFQDDLLGPTCVERMITVFLKHESVGLAFSPRNLIVDSDMDSPITREWVERCTSLHSKFSKLDEYNRGRRLFLEYAKGEFRGNWIGEPSCVMIKRECFDRVGLFNSRLRQNCDVEMWLRILFFYDVGFIADALSTFRVHVDSASHTNITHNRNRLDQLHLLNGLRSYEEIRLALPQLNKLRKLEMLRICIRALIPLNLRLRLRRLFRFKGSLRVVNRGNPEVR